MHSHEVHIEVDSRACFGKGRKVAFEAVAVKQIRFCLLFPGALPPGAGPVQLVNSA